MPKQNMRYLLLLCTKNVYFSKNRYANSMAMGSPLGPVLAGTFMVELEKPVLPNLREHSSPQKRYVDDTISFKKEKYMEHVLSKLNGYHDNIEFTLV